MPEKSKSSSSRDGDEDSGGRDRAEVTHDRPDDDEVKVEKISGHTTRSESNYFIKSAKWGYLILNIFTTPPGLRAGG